MEYKFILDRPYRVQEIIEAMSQRGWTLMAPVAFAYLYEDEAKTIGYFYATMQKERKAVDEKF